MQPPPRGCVLKLRVDISLHLGKSAAASTRLCVETILFTLNFLYIPQPPPRGCVLKPENITIADFKKIGSRLHAAVC